MVWVKMTFFLQLFFTEVAYSLNVFTGRIAVINKRSQRSFLGGQFKTRRVLKAWLIKWRKIWTFSRWQELAPQQLGTENRSQITSLKEKERTTSSYSQLLFAAVLRIEIYIEPLHL